MDQHEIALAALLGGDQRRAVSQACPGLVGEVGGRLGQHLLGDADILRNRNAEEGAVGRELVQRARLAPAHDAAQRAVAQAQRRRDKIVGASGEVGTGEAHGNAAALDPLGDLLAVVGRRRGAIRDQQHGGVARQHRFTIADAQAHIGIQRALEEVDLLQQRLSAGGGAFAEDGDGPATMTLVEKDRAASAALRLDVETSHAVAQLGRNGQYAFALGGGRGEIEVDAGHDAALLVGSLDRSLARAVGGRTQRAYLEVAAFGGRWQQKQGCRRLIGQQHLQAIEAAQAFGETGRAFIFEPVAQPHGIGTGVDLHLVDGGRGGRAIGRPGLGSERAQERAGFVGTHGAAPDGGRVEGRGGGADQHDRAIGALGPLDQALGMGGACGPARRARPAVVDHQQQRAAARQVGLRVQQRARDGQDQGGRQQQPQQQQPPRHLHRRLFGGLQADQQPDRGEAHQLRQRRDQPQQEVDRRQGDQQSQHAGGSKRERAEIQHVIRPFSADRDRPWRDKATAGRSAATGRCDGDEPSSWPAA